MTPIQLTRLQLEQALAHAEEQLAISDSLAEKAHWGIRCDQIEAGLADLQIADKPECTCDPTCGSGCEGCCEEEDDS